MEYYSLQPDEAVLYKGTVHFGSYDSDLTGQKNVLPEAHLILTNQKLVFISDSPENEQGNAETYPIEDIKIYNGNPQIRQTDCRVEIYLKSTEKTAIFCSAHEAKRFTLSALERITGKPLSVRYAEKIKKTISLVDDTLGTDAIGTVKSVLENGIIGAVFGKKAKKKHMRQKEKASVSGNPSNPHRNGDADGTKDTDTAASSLSCEEQMEALRKLKELLDAGILTQKEFDTQKKKILKA